MLDASRRFALSHLVTGLAEALDLVSPALTNHHKRTAYIAGELAREAGLSPSERGQLVAAGLIHDAGALSLSERLDLLAFEVDTTPGSPGLKHAQLGARLLSGFPRLRPLAQLVEHHHIHWQLRGELGVSEELAWRANLLHLADRVDVQLDTHSQVLSQTTAIREQIGSQSGRMFAPSLVRTFDSLARRQSFWLDVSSPYLNALLAEPLREWNQYLGLADLLSLARVFSGIIDYRSHFTATHSAGVAATAEALAQDVGFNPGDCLSMRLAGYLHDLGKLAVPREVLEKRGTLTPAEKARIRSHSYFTFRVLERIRGLEKTNTWASFHHERLDGEGYPFRRSEKTLCQGARILAVADVFTAITEERPYRGAMPPEKTHKVLEEMVRNRVLDGQIVRLVKERFDDLNTLRCQAQGGALAEFEELSSQQAASISSR